MTALDIVALVLIGGGAVFGWLKGFVHEALSLIAWVLAVVAVKFLHTPLTDAIAAPVGTPSGAAALSVVVLFGGTFLLGRLLAGALGRRTRQSVLGPVDRVLGLGFGVVKGLILVTLIFIAITFVTDRFWSSASARPDWIRDARSYQLLDASSRAMVDWLDERRIANLRQRDAK